MRNVRKSKGWAVAVGCMAVLVALSFQSLQAEIVPEIILEDGYLDIEYSAGSGQNVSYHVIDFASTGGESYAFTYHFDGPTKSAHAALLAIDAAGPLSYAFTSYDFGGGVVPFADNFSYLSELGDPNIFWSYSLGSYAALGTDVTWAGAPTGAGEQLLTDGSWHGWYNGFNGWDAVSPRVPAVGGHGVIPEPASIGLCMWGMFLLFVRRRCKPFF